MDNEVKIGDKIYLKEFGYLKKVEKVIRITKTMIITENNRFRIEANGFLNTVGNDRFCHTIGYLETPELKKESEEILLQVWFNANRDKFTIDQIRQIKTVIENYEKNYKKKRKA